MVKCKVVLAGGTGFIGQYFEKQFKEQDWEVVHISRHSEHVNWDNQKEIVAALEGAEMLINLAGRSVDCRYNEKNKKEILESRTETTRILGESIMFCDKPPALWLNSSTATIYRHAEDYPMSETEGEIGTGFSVRVAQAWEEMFFSFSLPHTRRVALRIAIVLGKGGGVIIPYLSLVQYGLAGRQGSGKQMFSWIHLEDLFRIALFLQQRVDIEGVINCAAPFPVTNSVLMRSLRKSMNVRFGLPMPVWLLKAGVALIGTEAELVLKSRWVLPLRLSEAGFEFHHATIDNALEHILKT